MLTILRGPRRNILIASTFAFAVILFIFVDGVLPRFSSSPIKSSNGAGPEPKASSKEAGIGTDSDMDGLLDWKEKLYGTNMYIADTDGDGTSDGNEVLSGRDPLTPGPNDRLSFLAGLEATTTSIDEARRKFLEEYLRLASRKIQEDAFNDVVAKFDPSKLEPRYSMSDLRRESRVATSAYKTYGNAFGSIIEHYTSKNIPSEDAIIEKMGAVRDDRARASAILKELDLPSANYRNFAADLYQLTVPEDLAMYHLLIVNGYDVMSRALQDLKNMYDSPVQAAGAYQAYMKAKYDVTVGYAGLVVSFAERQIVFGKDEPGAPFTWMPDGSAREKRGD